MIETARGLILRTRPLTETSLIIHWLTADAGRVATVAKGARRPKSPFAGKLDLFYLADFSFQRSRRSELHTLREVQLLEPHAAIRQDLEKLNQGAYAAAFIEQVTETETPLPEIYALIRDFLATLDRTSPGPLLAFALEIKLLQECGFAPDWGEVRLSPGAKKIAEFLGTESWQRITQIQTSTAQDEELRQWLQGFLTLHLGRLPRGRAGAVAPV